MTNNQETFAATRTLAKPARSEKLLKSEPKPNPPRK